jgi:hypothetical protein
VSRVPLYHKHQRKKVLRNNSYYFGPFLIVTAGCFLLFFCFFRFRYAVLDQVIKVNVIE